MYIFICYVFSLLDVYGIDRYEVNGLILYIIHANYWCRMSKFVVQQNLSNAFEYADSGFIKDIMFFGEKWRKRCLTGWIGFGKI